MPELVAQTNPFRADRIIHQWQPGETVADILKDLDPVHSGVRVWLGDIEVRPEYFHVVRPKSNSIITVKAYPEGGDALRSIAFIALAVAAAYTGGLAGGIYGGGANLSAGAISAGVSSAVFVAGALTINALIPIDTPELDNGSNESQALGVGAARNRLTPFGNLPTLFGFYQMTPPYAARPYTELVGEEQFVVMLFALGKKGMEVDIDGVKIGTTPANTYDDVQIELDTGGSADTGITMYSGSVFEDQAGKIIPGPSGYALHTTPANTDRVTYEIHFPRGLIKYEHNDGKRRKRTVIVTVWFSDSINGPWTELPDSPHSIQAKTAVLLRKGFSHTFPSQGQWHIRMQADVENSDGSGDVDKGPVVSNERFFQILRSYKNEPAVNDPNIALAAIRIKATDQLNGIPSQVSFYAQSIVPDGASWTDGVSNNPSSLIRWLLTGSPNARPLATTRLDNQSFVDFWNYCDINNLTFNQNVDFNTTIVKMMGMIARVGFSRVEQIDGIWKIITDVPQTTSLQVFTPRNSWGMSVTKSFPEKVHGFRIRFVDETNRAFTQEERIVYADGFDINNSTLFESIEAVGITTSDHIWKYGRRYLAISVLQPELFTFNVDPEHLASIIGNRIEVQHDALKIGLGAGRVKVADDTTVTIDAAVPSAGGATAYTIQFRQTDGNIFTEQIITPPAGDNDTFTFVNAPIATVLVAGDLAVYGEFQKVSQPVLIKNIEPMSEMAARVTCIPYADGVYTASSGTIPPYDPVLTEPPGAGSPVITQILSDEYVMWRDNGGTLQPRMVVSLGFINERVNVSGVIVQFRVYSVNANSATNWESLSILPADAGLFSITGVSELDQIELRTRYAFLDGTSGVWSTYYDTVAQTAYHTVVGKTSRPPSLANFNVIVQASGLREYRFDFGTKLLPPDMDGFEIYYFDTDDLTGAAWDYGLIDDSVAGGSFVLVDTSPAGGNFELIDIIADTPELADMTELYNGRIRYSPFEYNAPFTGEWIFAIVSVDVGNLQSDPIYTPRILLPPPQLGNSLFYLDHSANNWLAGQSPGAVLDASWQISALTGYLQANLSNTWGVHPATWQSSFTDGWLGTSGAGGFTYTHEVNLVAFNPPITSGTTVNLRLGATTEASAGTYSFEWAVNGSAVWTGFVDGETIDTLQSSVSSIEFRLTGLNVPVEGLRNWVVEGFTSA